MTPLEKAQAQWGYKLHAREIVYIAPLGSRDSNNELIYNRLTGQVMTGWISGNSAVVAEPPHGCFHGTLTELEAKLEKDYGGRVNGGYLTEYARIAQRRWDEYKAALAFLRALPPLADTGAPESGLGADDLPAL